MIPTRAALALPAAVLVLSGCGAASADTMRTTTQSVAPSDPVRNLPRPAVTPAALPTATPAPTPPATVRVVVTIPASGGEEWLEILSSSGAALARTEINPANPWMANAGAGGAYWTQNGVEHELTPSGAVRSLGSIPSDANGVVISPDGGSYAYATSDTLANGSVLNRIIVVRPGQAPQVIADRVSDPNHPTSGAPEEWDYYLISWTAPGIAFARVPSGGCGCGSFDMQMQSAFSGLINPSSMSVTTLTADNACPLSNVGPGAQSICFADSTTTGATTAVRIAAGALTHSYSLSGANVAGNAVFASTGSAVAYETIPVSQDTCDAPLTPTLHVLTVANGAARAANVGNFTPAAWAPGGAIYGQLQSGPAAWVAAVDPGSLAVTRLTPNIPGVAFIGLV
jgi:hypothetical protein